MTVERLPALRTALQNVASAPVNIVVYGDSVVEGTGATALDKRITERLQRRLRTDYPVSGVPSAQVATAGYIPSYYPMDVFVPWTSPATTGAQSDTFGGLGACTVHLGNAETITFVGTGDRVEVHYIQTDFLTGPFSVQIDGSTVANLTSYNASAGAGNYLAATWTSALLDNTSHTVLITGTSGYTAVVAGVKFYSDDYGKSIHVYNGGHGGWTADQHQFSSQSHLAMIQPDLAVIALGFNDAGGGYSPSLFGDKLDLLIGKIKTEAPLCPIVVLGLYNPRDATWSASWPDYITSMDESAAAVTDGRMLDISTTMPDTWANPSLYADLIHPSDAGHDMIADLLAEFIEQLALSDEQAAATYLSCSTSAAFVPFASNAFPTQYTTLIGTAPVWSRNDEDVSYIRCAPGTSPAGGFFQYVWDPLAGASPDPVLFDNPRVAIAAARSSSSAFVEEIEVTLVDVTTSVPVDLSSTATYSLLTHDPFEAAELTLTLLPGVTASEVRALYMSGGSPSTSSALGIRLSVTHAGDPEDASLDSYALVSYFGLCVNTTFQPSDVVETSSQVLENSQVALAFKPATQTLRGLCLGNDVELNGLVLNRLDDNGVIWIVTDIEGWWTLAPPDVPDIPRGWGDGSYSVRGRKQSRPISLSGVILPPDRAFVPAVRQQLLQALNLVHTGGWLKTFEGGVWRGSYVWSVDTPQIATVNARGRTEFSVGLRAADPIKYLYSTDPTPGDGFQSSEAILVSNGNSGGRLYDRSYDWEYDQGGPVQTGLGTVVNAGDATVPAVFYVYGPVYGPAIIVNQTTGETMTIVRQLAEGDILTIDTSTRAVLLNGSRNQRWYLGVDIDWITLVPGANRLFFNDAGGSMDAQLIVHYRSGWIG